MTERRQHRLVQAGVLTFGLAAAMVLLWVSTRPGMGGLALGRMESDCGCGLIAYSPIFGATWTARLLIGATVIVWARLAFFLWRGLRRSRAHIDGLESRGFRMMHHARTGLRYVLVPRTEPLAVTAGMLKPRIYVSTGLVRELSNSELEAVLAHEAAHVRARDPLLAVLLEAVTHAYWRLPWLKAWTTSSYTLRELAADADATRGYRRLDGLAGAFLKLAAVEAPADVIGFSPNRDRLEKLLDADWRPTLRLWRWEYGAGMAILVALVFGLARFSQTQAATAAVVMPQACHEVRLYCPHERQASRPAVMVQSRVFMYVVQSPAR